MISSNYLFGAGGGEGGGDLEDFSGGGGHKVFSGNLGGGEMSLPTEYKGGIVENWLPINCWGHRNITELYGGTQ